MRVSGFREKHVGGAVCQTHWRALATLRRAAAHRHINTRSILSFCSAKLTHAAVSATELALSICPYGIFACETKAKPGQITVGFRRPLPAPSKLTREAYGETQALMTDIITEATGG